MRAATKTNVIDSEIMKKKLLADKEVYERLQVNIITSIDT